MKSSIIVLLLIALALVSHGQGEFYPKRWSHVYKDELKSLTKSALAEVDTLYTLAKKENNIQALWT